MKNLAILEVLERKRNINSCAYRTFDRETEVSTYQISTGQGQPATSHERRVRKERRRWWWISDRKRKPVLEIANMRKRNSPSLVRDIWVSYAHLYMTMTAICEESDARSIPSRWTIECRDEGNGSSHIHPTDHLKLARCLLSLLGTTRRRRLGFSGELLEDIFGVIFGYKEKRIPGTRNASKLVRYGLQFAREERVSRFARRWRPLPSVTRVGKARADQVGSSKFVSRFKGMIVSYCKVSIDSS